MPNSTHSITSLLFDWDGTLADSAPLGLAAFQKTFAEMRVPFSQELYDAMVENEDAQKGKSNNRLAVINGIRNLKEKGLEAVDGIVAQSFDLCYIVWPFLKSNTTRTGKLIVLRGE